VKAAKKPRPTADPIHWRFRVSDRAAMRNLCATTKADRRIEGSIVLKPTFRQGTYYAYNDDTFDICGRCTEIGTAMLRGKEI
jgi:hypothetical protein